MDWKKHQGTWPLAAFSRFVDCPPHRWHVQILGEGPHVVLFHGAGGATQSFRSLAPLLAQQYRVLMMDLPGQGFTRYGTRQRCGMRPMADDLVALMEHLKADPALLIGHSAGAALALDISDRHWKVPAVGINPALGHFEGAAGWLFPALAKMLAATPFASHAIARAAQTPGRVEGLLASTGSSIDPAGTELYRQLASNPGHVEATLHMMAQWSIDGLLQRLPGIDTPCLFIAGSHDGAVPPRVAQNAARKMPHADLTMLPNEGHLLHETSAQPVANAIAAFMGRTQVVQPSRV